MPSAILEPLTASLPTPDSLNQHGGPGGQGLNSAGPGTPLYPGPSPGPGGPGQPGSNNNPGFATPTHGGGGGHTPLPGQGSHFVHGPPSYNSSPVPPGPSTPGQGGGNSNHFPSPGPGYNPQGGGPQGGGPGGPHFNGPSGAPPPFGSPYPSPGSVGHPPQGHPGFPGPGGPQGFGPGPNGGGPGPGHPGFVGHPSHGGGGPMNPGVMGGPMGGPGGPMGGGHPQNMGGPPMGPGGPNPGAMGPMSGPGPMSVPMGPGGPPGGAMGGPGDHGGPGGPPFFGRRHPGPYFNQPDYRIYELNKRLQQRTEVVAMESDNLWWDAFATEFFEDDATLTLTFCLEDGPKRYTIGRTLIPRYFRTIFEGGVTELNYQLRHSKESFHQTSITLDCDQCTMVTQHGKPMYTKVCTEGRLILEFTFDDMMRIKSWHFAVRTHRELVPRSVLALQASNQDPNLLDQMSKNVTRQGITPATLNYLRLCVILEPMQELMSRHKAYALSPRDCLKTTLFQKWQRMVAPPETQRPPNKRRKRKGSQTGGGAGINQSQPAAPNKKRSPGPSFSLASQDVMVVGEPSLMGGEFGDEDERLITRLENTQYDPAVSMDDPSGGGGPPSVPPSQFNSGPPAELGCRTSGPERSQSVGRSSKAGRRK